jgi:N-acetylglutamate synthase-like GNAT family acetyltransferase
MFDTVLCREDEEAVTELLTQYKLGDFHTAQGEVVVLRESEAIVGCAACLCHPAREGGRPHAWLNCIAVRKTRLRQGFGKKLVGYFIASHCPEHELWLETAFWNKRFYTSLGFVWVPIKDINQYFSNDPRSRKNTMVMVLM